MELKVYIFIVHSLQQHHMIYKIDKIDKPGMQFLTMKVSRKRAGNDSYLTH